MKSQPTPPPAPDYAAANEAGVQADIDALPLRNAINAATTLGTSYTDPNSGKTYDFTGLGSQDIAHQQLMQQLKDAPDAAAALLQIQQQYGPEFAAAARQSLQATDPTGFAMRDAFAGDLASGRNSASSLVAGNDIKAPNYEQLLGSGPHLSALAGDKPNFEYLGDGPTMGRVGDINLADTGLAKSGRAGLEQQVFDELAQTGQIDPVLQRQYEQSSRARGASTGNTSGSAGALDEAMAVQQAQSALDQSRRSNALSLLQSGQTTSDKANTLAQQQQASDLASTGFNNVAAQAEFDNSGKKASFNNSAQQQDFSNQAAITDQNNATANQSFQNAMAAIGQRNQALQNSFQSQQAVQQTQLAANQQDTANKQSFLGLAPIVSQGAQLAGLQQGAAPTTSGTGYGAVGTAQNAGQLGSAFAGNIFGTQANIFGTQSQAATAANGQMTGLASSFICHVARLVYGHDNGKWVVFYHWKEHAAPKLFKRFYNTFAPQLAAMIRPFPSIQHLVRLWMDSKLQLA